MITKKILEKEIEINRNRIKNEERLKKAVLKAYEEEEISFEEFDIELSYIYDNIITSEREIEMYETLINKYCKEP